MTRNSYGAGIDKSDPMGVLFEKKVEQLGRDYGITTGKGINPPFTAAESVINGVAVKDNAFLFFLPVPRWIHLKDAIKSLNLWLCYIENAEGFKLDVEGVRCAHDNSIYVRMHFENPPKEVTASYVLKFVKHYIPDAQIRPQENSGIALSNYLLHAIKYQLAGTSNNGKVSIKLKSDSLTTKAQLMCAMLVCILRLKPGFSSLTHTINILNAKQFVLQFKMAAPQKQPYERLCMLLKGHGLSNLILVHTNKHMMISSSMQAARDVPPIQTFFSGQHNSVSSYNPPERPYVLKPVKHYISDGPLSPQENSRIALSNYLLQAINDQIVIISNNGKISITLESASLTNKAQLMCAALVFIFSLKPKFSSLTHTIEILNEKQFVLQFKMAAPQAQPI
ncbi:MAG: hypothetical protein COB66_07060, partial [Coxiella sp. (in: Bacteria)]